MATGQLIQIIWNHVKVRMFCVLFIKQEHSESADFCQCTLLPHIDPLKITEYMHLYVECNAT